MKVTTNNSLLQFIRLVKSALNGKANSKHNHSVATTSANGLMSPTDKTKLDGIASGANKYSLPTATSSVLGGVKVGSNITNSSGTISLTKANVTSALGYTPPTTNTTYGVATTTSNGLMSSTDKVKLENVAVDVEEALNLFLNGTSEAEFEAELDKILN